MQTSVPGCQSETQLSLDTADQRIRALFEQGRYQESLDICLQTTQAYPSHAKPWADAAINYLLLGRWQDAIGYAQTALTRDPPYGDENNFFGTYAALAHAYGVLGQWDKTRRYGLQALNLRARAFGGEPAIPLTDLAPLPPLPSAQMRKYNIIAFSLFGGNPKYCETAILNVQEQPQIYPYWICRFYVDDSVPESVIERLRAGGAQIVQVQGSALQWPGPMWRLLALDDPQARRILFRDADSLISQREAHAVDQWLTSGKRFHMMRDSCTHTELLMAGLWGAVAGSLPPLRELMHRFMRTPIESMYFADQRFLRQCIWPYARTSLMQHDSVFGFMDAVPFPDGDRPHHYSRAGHLESYPFSMKVNLPDGLEVTWKLFQIKNFTDDQTREEQICCYSGNVKDGTVSTYIPAHYAQWIQQGTIRVRVEAKIGV
jgi:hypothetical protein